MGIFQTSRSVSDPLSFSEIKSAIGSSSISIPDNDGNSLRDYLAHLGKSNSQVLSIHDFQGIRYVKNYVLSDVSTGLDLNAIFTASTEYVGWNQTDPFILNVYIFNGVNVYNSTLGGAGITVGNLPSTVSVFLNINGNVIGGPGQGGVGGDGGAWSSSNPANSYYIAYAQDGQQGGHGGVQRPKRRSGAEASPDLQAKGHPKHLQLG